MKLPNLAQSRSSTRVASRFSSGPAWARLSLVLSMGLLTSASVLADETGGPTARPATANLYLISPAHGEQLRSPVTVRFGLRGMGIAPAGTEAANSGHHHLLVDVAELPDLSQPLPSSEQVLHFGKGQTETQLNLSPGHHRLQLILGDHLHRPHNPPLMSAVVEIEVVE